MARLSSDRKFSSIRVAAAVRANQAATSALSAAELDQFMDMMNRVIDALQEARS